MDSEEPSKKNKEGEHNNSMSNGRDVFQSTWLRRAFQDGNGLDRFLLDYGRHFLLRISFILYFVLFIKEVL